MNNISVWIWRTVTISALGGFLFVVLFQPEIHQTPSLKKTLHTEMSTAMPPYNRFDHDISIQQVEEHWNEPETEFLLSPENGTVEINQTLLEDGRHFFYTESFGNETFFTDVVGLLNGPLTKQDFAKALIQLRGRGTHDLQIVLSQEATIGEKNFPKGTVIHTGLDVPKGSYLPLGMSVKITADGPKVGAGCAICHSTVNEHGQVIDGAPNQNLNIGTLLAMGTNSAAYFRQTNVSPSDIQKGKHAVTAANGKKVYLPEPAEFEKKVDKIFLSWPKGNFDSTLDLKANPSQIPDSFTFGDYPYGWNGFAAFGPFHGLGPFSSNVHAANADPLTTIAHTRQLFNLDKEVYIGSILQQAANKNFRLPKNEKPSAFLKRIDPNPQTPGFTEAVKLPSFPDGSYVAPDGLLITSPGQPIGYQVNAMAAWQNSLLPPPLEAHTLATKNLAEGRNVFQRAGCASCHNGPAFTNHQVISVEEVKTQPSRAGAFKKLPQTYSSPQLWSFHGEKPEDPHVRKLDVPLDQDVSRQSLHNAYAVDNQGGYKVKGLIGLAYTAPYLHDGGVAVGKGALQAAENGWYHIADDSLLGIPGTLEKNLVPDAQSSLRALVDRHLRQRVIETNQQSSALQMVNVDGRGHPYWVDKKAGFTAQEQTALINYLLSLNQLPNAG